MEKLKVLNQILVELQSFLLILDKENLSGNATVQKSVLSDLLLSYIGSNGGDEYIYMNKVTAPDDKDNGPDAVANGKARRYVTAPQKGLPDLPLLRPVLMCQEPFPLDPGEGYYEEAQPYEEAINDDGDALSSSYESYDEDEAVVRGTAPGPLAQHQWPSPEASIELVRDALICAFLWRKKWLGQWSKQLCVIKDCRLQCYKSSKEQTPLLDVSLRGCSVVYKEKHMKRKEHNLKIIPVGGEAIVLGLQSKEQTEQWLRVILDISFRPTESCEVQHPGSDSPRLLCTKGEMSERHLVASESGGGNTDGHAETHDPKDVKKKYGAGLKFSNLMNIGKKKTSLLDSPEKCVDTSGYLNVLVNSQWRSRWCLIRDGQLWFYSDKGKGKVSQPAVALGGCSVVPLPSPEHLYTFRIDLDGTQLATLEAKTSADMGQWLGFLLSQTGTRMEPEDLTYDYINTERISTIINAAKTSMYLMQRRYSEPNAYIDNGPPGLQPSDDLYDDVASIGADPEDVEESELPVSEENGFQEDAGIANGPSAPEVELAAPLPPPSPPPPPPPAPPIVEEEPAVAAHPENQETDKQVYLDVTPVRSFLHTSGGKLLTAQRESCAATSTPASPREEPPLDSPTAQTVELEPSNQNRELEPPRHTPEGPGPASPDAGRSERVSSLFRPPHQRQRSTLPPPPPPPQGQEPLAKTAPSPGHSPVLAAHRSPSSPGASVAHKSPSSPRASVAHKSPSSPGASVAHQSPSSPRAGVAHKAPQPGPVLGLSSPGLPPLSPQSTRPKTLSAGCQAGAVEVKLGKNRTEADVRRYSEERDCLEKKREEVRSSLAGFKKERRDTREELHACQGDPRRKASLEAILKQKEEACREAENRRVEVELRLMEVRESLRKVEAGPFTLGTTLDSTHQDLHTSKVPSMAPTVAPPPPPSTNGTCVDSASPVNCATALKNRPTTMMATSKVNVLQKAKEWEKKSTS